MRQTKAESAGRCRREWAASPWSGSGLGSERPVPENERGNAPGRDGPRCDLTKKNKKELITHTDNVLTNFIALFYAHINNMYEHKNR